MSDDLKYSPPRFDKGKKKWIVDVGDGLELMDTFYFEEFTDAWKFYNTYKRNDFKQEIKNKLRHG